MKWGGCVHGRHAECLGTTRHIVQPSPRTSFLSWSWDHECRLHRELARIPTHAAVPAAESWQQQRHQFFFHSHNHKNPLHTTIVRDYISQTCRQLLYSQHGMKRFELSRQNARTWNKRQKENQWVKVVTGQSGDDGRETKLRPFQHARRQHSLHHLLNNHSCRWNYMHGTGGRGD